MENIAQQLLGGFTQLGADAYGQPMAMPRIVQVAANSMPPPYPNTWAFFNSAAVTQANSNSSPIENFNFAQDPRALFAPAK